MLKGSIVHMGHHGAVVQPRFAAILIALCLLVGIVGFSSSLSGAIGVPADGVMPQPGTPNVPPIESPTAGASETAGALPDLAVTGTGTTPTLTPTVTPTEYLEQDATGSSGAPAPSPSLPTTSPVTTPPTSVPSAGAETARSTQATTAALPDATPHATDRTEKVPLSASEPTSIVAHLGVQGGVYSPSSITVPAGAEVTIVFENQDEDVPHNVVVYAENAAPVFVGTVITGPGRTTDTFTAPSTPGRYALGCSIPKLHRKGSFIVE